MKLLRNVLCLTAVIGAASLAFAVETPFAGTWKLNLSKSKLVGDTVKFAPAGNAMRITAGSESYEFKPDGTASKTSFGTASWKKVDDQTWEETDMVNGRLDSTNTWTLTKDGKTLTEHTTGDKPGGGRFDDTTTFVRIAGTSGLAGTWKDREYKGSSPSLIVISDRDDGLTFDEPDFKLKATANFDGKPGTVEGPSIPPGAYFMISRVNSHRFKMTRTQNGKPFDSSTWTVSPDGKVMTMVARTAGTTDPPITEVFEKQ
jgi:hypothetical protein